MTVKEKMITETWIMDQELENYLREISELVLIKPDQFENLCIACRTHTVGVKADNITIGTCWDADRMDIEG